MKSIVWTLVLCCNVYLYAGQIPENWKNNPRLGIIYITKKRIQAGKYTAEVPEGSKVMISRRFFSYQLRLSSAEKKGLGILIVGGKNEDDPGPYDAKIPYLSASEYLTETNEQATATHWEVHHAKYADKEIPNLKPNHYFQHTFPLNVYPAQAYNGKRPMLLGVGMIVRMITPSPHCREDEVTVRFNEKGSNMNYIREIQQDNPSFVLAQPDLGTDYCVSYFDFTHDFSPTGGEIREALPDAVTWDEVNSRYHSNFVLKAMKEAIVKVSPYTQDEIKEGRMAPTIRVIPVNVLAPEKSKDLPMEGWVAEYSGTLYYSCAGGACRAQGYQIVFDSEGRLEKFLKNRLYSWDGHVELPLDSDDEKRLIELVNNETMLKELHNFAKTKSGGDYAAKMSGLSSAKKLSRASGNSYATFVIHVSRIREKLGLKNRWPIYDGASPKSSNAKEVSPK